MKVAEVKKGLEVPAQESWEAVQGQQAAAASEEESWLCGPGAGRSQRVRSGPHRASW